MKAKELRQGGDGGQDFGKGAGKGKGKEKGDRSERSSPDRNGASDHKCKFYLTDAGCRKGKDCSWSHDRTDGKRRCYSCGSIDHYAPDCPRKSTSSGGMGNNYNNKNKAAKNVEENPKDENNKKVEDGGAASSSETMQQLLTEANKMLKSLGAVDRPAETSHDEKMKALQRQLDDLKGRSLRALKLTRISRGSFTGLIDSGATHPMRGRKPGEDVTKYQQVKVALANGKEELLRMTEKGIMVEENAKIHQVEPIVPFGMLIAKLECKVIWNKDEIEVNHPTRGVLAVRLVNGCPQVSRNLALQLIEDIEEKTVNLIYSDTKACSMDARM